MMNDEVQWTGFWVGGFASLALTVVKLASALRWSWWRVWLPLWVVLLHNAVYVGAGFIWLTWKGWGRRGDHLSLR